jgi:hypothetical protein
VYRTLPDRVVPGPWSFQAGWMKGERDLSRIAGCACMEALLHPGRSVKADLSPLPMVKEAPGWNLEQMPILSREYSRRAGLE